MVKLLTVMLMCVMAVWRPGLCASPPAGSALPADEGIPGSDSLARVRYQLMRDGFLGADIKAGKVIAGPMFKIREIVVSSPQEFSLRELRLAGYPGQSATALTMDRIRERVSAYLLENGYLFFSLSFDLEEVRPPPPAGKSGKREGRGQVRLMVTIASGSEYKLGDIQFSGTKTKPTVLSRLSLLTRGDTYEHHRVGQARKKLARTGYFHFVEEGPLSRDSLRNLLYPAMYMSDVKGNSISGVFGYASEAGERGGGLEGFLDINLFNLAGTARDFAFTFSGRPEQKQVHMNYKEPFLWTLPLGAGLDLSLLLEDSVYNERSLGVTLFQDIDFFSRYLLSYTGQENETFSEGPDGRITSVRSTAIITGIETVFDWRNAAPHTLSGGTVSIGLNGIRRNTSDSIDYLVQNRNIIKYWLPISKRSVLHHKLAGAGVWPLEKSLGNRGNLFQVGGAQTIRGYRENEFLTNLYLYANVELQYLLSDRNRIYLLVDPGLINKNQGDVYWNRVLGYGVGADLGSRDWIFGISYALSTERKFEEGLVHVKVVNNF
ncbi:POTRA domain-containing protein [Fibrobacterota bacterium]